MIPTATPAEHADAASVWINRSEADPVRVPWDQASSMAIAHSLTALALVFSQQPK